tara:strand:- start:4510 stop:4848 length:339 start_codon:yes stop_codon:yes gene_type:complete
MFFDNIVSQISRGKGIDRLVQNSENIQQVKDSILGSDDIQGNLLERVREFAAKYGISTEDLKNLTIANLLIDLKSKTNSDKEHTMFSNLLNLAKGLGLSDKTIGAVGRERLS